MVRIAHRLGVLVTPQTTEYLVLTAVLAPRPLSASSRKGGGSGRGGVERTRKWQELSGSSSDAAEQEIIQFTIQNPDRKTARIPGLEDIEGALTELMRRTSPMFGCTCTVNASKQARKQAMGTLPGSGRVSGPR